VRAPRDVAVDLWSPIKGALPPASRPAAPPRSTRARHRSRRGELPPLAGCALNQALPHLPLHPPKLATHSRAPPKPPSPEQDGRRGYPSLAAGAHPAGPSPSATEHGNRSPGTQGPSPARARPAPADGWPEFGRTAAGRPPRDYIAKERIFSGASPQKGNSNSKVIWLFLVNCVGNWRKLGKMQNQFCWVRCEISHNCYYFFLS
jgi:hypothetical protein